MLCRVVLILSLLWSGAAVAAEVTDSTGRTARVPDRVARVLPAGPPAAILLEAIAPDLMVGWPGSMSGEAKALLAPEGQGTFRPSGIEAIRTLDPDILIFSDPAMRDGVVRTEAWRTVRAVREGNVHVAPALPFGWAEKPPSINRLLGLAWLRGHEPAALAATFSATAYGHALRPEQLDAVLAGVRQIKS